MLSKKKYVTKGNSVFPRIFPLVSNTTKTYEEREENNMPRDIEWSVEVLFIVVYVQLSSQPKLRSIYLG